MSCVTSSCKKIQTLFIFRVIWENTAHVPRIKYSPKGSHLIHGTSAVFSHIAFKWASFVYLMTPFYKPIILFSVKRRITVYRPISKWCTYRNLWNKVYSFFRSFEIRLKFPFNIPPKNVGPLQIFQINHSNMPGCQQTTNMSRKKIQMRVLYSWYWWRHNLNLCIKSYCSTLVTSQAKFYGALGYHNI